MTIGMSNALVNKEGNVDRLSQNYEEMNETGKKKLKQVADQILGIYEIVNEKDGKK